MNTFTITIKTFNPENNQYLEVANPSKRVYLRSQKATPCGSENIYAIYGSTANNSKLEEFLLEVTTYTTKNILAKHQERAYIYNILTETEQVFRLCYKAFKDQDPISEYFLIACISTINECLKSVNQLLLPEEYAYNLITWVEDSAYLDIEAITATVPEDSPCKLTILKDQDEGLTMRVNEPAIITL